MAADKDDVVLLDPKKQFFAYNFAIFDDSDPNRFFETQDHLLNQTGLLFPVKNTNFKFVFVSMELLNKLTDDGTSPVPFQTAEPLMNSLAEKQKMLLDEYTPVCRAFSELLRFSPEEAVYKQWIDSNCRGTPSNGEGDRYCIFDRKWRTTNSERLSAIKTMCNKIDIQKSPRLFFKVFREIDLAMKELQMMKEQTNMMKEMKAWVAALQKFYDDTMTELATPYDMVREALAKDSERRKENISNLIERSEKSGVKLSGPAKEFLMMEANLDGNPLEPVCHTFCLPEKRVQKKRSGQYEKMTRLDLEKKICELDKKLEPYESKIRDMKQSIPPEVLESLMQF